MPVRFRHVFAALVLLCAAYPARAQAKRMERFVAALRDMRPMEEIASFFPRRAAWEFVHAPPHREGRRLRVEPGQTLPMIREDGELCASFGGVTGDVGMGPEALVSQAQLGRGRWRAMGGNRFVPPGRGASSRIFVEWTREDGRWVIARAGDETGYAPRVLGVVVGSLSADTLAGAGLPPERRYAVNTAWFEEHRPVYVGGRQLQKYGLPRSLGDDEVQLFGTLGVTPFYVERGSTGTPDVVYAPVGPGQYQPYQSMINSVCRD